MENLLEDIEQYVTSYLNDHLDTSFVYHNLAHTQRVVSKAKELIEESDLTEADAELLLIGAWFHDIGFTETIEGHEKQSETVHQTQFFHGKSLTKLKGVEGHLDLLFKISPFVTYLREFSSWFAADDTS